MSFPEGMASEGQLEALYRFLNNDDVTFGQILKPHAAMSAARCSQHADLLVLHDTTSLEFAGERRGLGRLHAGSRSGFFLHASLAVTPARDPLGILAAQTWSRTRPMRSRA